MNKIIVLVTLVITLSSIASAIEVGGHLTEDTTWSSENNPYVVTENLFVDSGVTLNILPGTEIYFNSASCTSWSDIDQNFWYPNNAAKMMWVEGRIIAEGTESDKILFSKLQNNEDYFWGCIYVTEDADFSIFKSCVIEYSAGIGIAVGQIAEASLSFYNGRYIVNNCTFFNNAVDIYGYYNTYEVEVTDSQFSNEILNNFVNTLWVGGSISLALVSPNNSSPLVAGNNISNIVKSNFAYDCNFIYNTIDFTYNSGIVAHSVDRECYLYYNNFLNCATGIEVNDNDYYIKNNSFTGGNDAINAEYSNVEIRDNYFDQCRVNIAWQVEYAIFINNYIKNSNLFCGSINNISNNIFFNNEYALSGVGSESFTNNVFINNEYIFSHASENHLIENNIFFNNDNIYDTIYGNPTFRNCLIDFQLDPPLVDGGRNIIVMSADVNRIFEDYENGDFRLAANSIAIDAGFDTLGYYYPFDLENSVRVWDGNGDGNAIIDIGAYEYGATQLGKISGYITETFSGEPVNYVLLKANNEPGEFTFADSSGYFEIQLPEGTYDLYAERVFYEDNIIYTVTVENEQTTEIEFNMTYEDPLVGIEDNEINVNSIGLNTFNYPNPFNPSTTISFNLPTNSNVSVEVYNVKGQKVKTLLHEKMPQGQHEVVWYGLNDKNKPVSSGVYFYKVRTGKQESVKRMILLK